MNIASRITENFSKLSAAQKKVAHYMLENTEEIVVYSAKKIAEASHVSEATVHRLAQTLGFDSFSDMKQDIHHFVKNDHRAVNNFVSKMALKQDSWLEAHFLQEADNIIQTSKDISQKDINEAATALLKADRIWIAGWRMGLSVSAYMQFVMKYMLGNCQLIPQGETAEYATYLKKGDVLFVTSYPRYCQNTLKISTIAREKGLYIIAITDNQLAPICNLSDTVLFAKNKSTSFLDSYTAAVSVCNAIVNEVAYIGKERVMANIQEMEVHFSTFHS